MKTIILHTIIPFILTITFFIGCSTSSEVIKVSKSEIKPKLNDDDRKKMALSYFIDGGVFETQGNFSAAIAKYENALEYDTTAGLFYSLAKNYLFMNKLASSLNYAQQALNLDSSRIEYYDLLADVYNFGNQPDSAILILEKAIKIDSTNIELNYKLARLYEEDKPAKAIRIYNKILYQLGLDWTILARIAELQERLGNNDEAIEAIKKLLSLDPANIPLKKMLVQFYLKANKYDEGIKAIDEIIEVMPYDLEARETKAKLLLGKEDWNGAAKEFEYLMEQPDINLEAKVAIGAIYFNKSVTDSAMLPIAKSFFTKLDMDTTDWQVKMYLGAIALNEHNDSIAIDNFKYVTENAQWNEAAWVRLGGLYFDNKKYAESEVVMSEAILSFPESFYVNLILGLSLTQNSKHKEAEKFLKKATLLNPTDITALSAYGFTLSQLKQDGKAVFYISQALAIEPDEVQLIGTLAMIYNGMKNFELSDSLYESALKLKPDDPLINNNYSYALSERGIQLERALEMVKISIAADSLNSSYLDTIGWVYFKLGNYPEAKINIEKAIEVGGKSSVMLDHLADIEFKLGNIERAIELWKEAFELEPTNTEIQTKIEKGAI